MKIEELNEQFNWGVVTPEFMDSETKQAVHVFNHNLESVNMLAFNLIFIIGRLKWYLLHLPNGTSQIVKIDDRGQKMQLDLKNKLRSALKQYCESIEFFSEKR
jgi:hypothetical protein